MRVRELLRDLVAIDSVNPRGGGAVGGESAVAQYVHHWAASHGFSAELTEVDPGRHNVIVRIDGALPGTLLLQTHLDTVETDGMVVEPFVLTERDGRWYGRGSCDAKGQLAIFMAAIEMVPAAERHSVILAGCTDEEESFHGVSHLCRNGSAGIGHDLIGGVVGEPTELRCVVAHKGVLRGGFTAHGPGGHSSRPAGVPNPIVTMAEVASYLSGPHADELRGLSHPLVGEATLTLTMISGGDAINIIPRSVTLRYDRRTLPAEDPLKVLDALRRSISARWPEVVVDPPSLADGGLDAGVDSEIVRRMGLAVAQQGLDPTPVGVPYGSDASKINRIGIPCVVFGAGSIGDAHTPDESVEIEQVLRGVDVIAALLRGNE